MNGFMYHSTDDDVHIILHVFVRLLIEIALIAPPQLPSKMDPPMLTS